MEEVLKKLILKCNKAIQTIYTQTRLFYLN